MARFLLATVPSAGHLLPVLPIAQRLVSCGYEVAWITGCAFEQRIVQTGACFFAWPPAIDSSINHIYDLYPEMGQLEGLARAKFYLKHIFLGTCPVMLEAIDEALQVFPAQVFIGDNAMFALFLKGEELGQPSAKLSVLPLGVPSRDTAPFGMGLQPGRSALARLRNRMLNDFVYSQLLSDLNDEANRLRQGLGLAPLEESFLIAVWHLPQLVMQMTTPAFEYPRSDSPPHIHFIGPSLPDALDTFERPSWWRDLAGPEPVVLINQGTVEANAADLLLPAIEALRDSDAAVKQAAVRALCNWPNAGAKVEKQFEGVPADERERRSTEILAEVGLEAQLAEGRSTVSSITAGAFFEVQGHPALDQPSIQQLLRGREQLLQLVKVPDGTAVAVRGHREVPAQVAPDLDDLPDRHARG